MVLVLICILSYVLGSVPSGLILGRLLWQVDLREHGSCNIGATNAWRTIGRPAGLLIFAWLTVARMRRAGLQAAA